MEKQRIKRIGVLPAAKLGAVIYFFLTVIFVVPFLIIAEIAGGVDYTDMFVGGGIFAIILIPFLNAVFGFIGTAIGCSIYNLVAGWVGGLVVELETTAVES